MVRNLEFAGTPLTAALDAAQANFCEGFLDAVERVNFPKATVLTQDVTKNYNGLVRKVPLIPLPRYFKSPPSANWSMVGYPIGITRDSVRDIIGAFDNLPRMNLPEQVYLCADRTLRLGTVLVDGMKCVLDPTDLQKNNPQADMPEVVIGRVLLDCPPLPDPPMYGDWWIPPHDNMKTWMPPHWCTFAEMDVCSALTAALA